MKKKAIVLGAGIQGVLSAFQLAKKGYSVVLLDKAIKPLSRASTVNEGKIHLGLIWANDPSFDTAEYMMESALKFAPLVEELVGCKVPWQNWLSKPFDYVCVNDSLLTPIEINIFYEKLEALYQEKYKGDFTYLGTSPDFISKQKASIPSYLNKSKVSSIWETNELSLLVSGFNQWLLELLEKFGNIYCEMNTEVYNVRESSLGYEVEVWHEGKSRKLIADVVVNCTWESRMSIDEKLGYVPDYTWTYRLKHALLTTLPKSLEFIPSLTFVLGPYGDIVNFGKEKVSYVSWYPEGMKHKSGELKTPESWENICNGIIEDEVKAELLKRNMLHGFSEIVPGILECESIQLKAGIIYSRGDSEILDVKSEVHKRFDVGIQFKREGYFSIDTGKYTSAPLHAHHLGLEL